MKTMYYILTLILPLSLAVIFSLLLVRGEMCSAMTIAAPGNDITALRNKAIAAFKSKCRVEKEHQLYEIKSCSFITEPLDPHRFDFILGPITMPFRLDFKLKAPADAMIALAENKTDGSLFAEIDIGGWSNTKSVIGACHSDTCQETLAIYDENGIISAEESRPFWIEYKEGVIMVGKGGQEKAFMEWDAGTYHQRVPTRVYVGISTWRVVHGDWLFYQFCD